MRVVVKHGGRYELIDTNYILRATPVGDTQISIKFRNDYHPRDLVIEGDFLDFAKLLGAENVFPKPEATKEEKKKK